MNSSATPGGAVEVIELLELVAFHIFRKETET